MADRDDQSHLPPIPDGGLAESMPDWLRRPPAWRTLPEREVAIPEPEAAAELPAPDASVIDPRTFLSDDDLPAWLRALGPGRRAGSAAGTAEASPPSESRAHTAVADPRGRDAAADTVRLPGPARFVPTSPAAPVPGPGSSGTPRADGRLAPRPVPPARTSGQPAGAVVVLAGLLLIAIVVIVVLLVA